MKTSCDKINQSLKGIKLISRAETIILRDLVFGNFYSSFAWAKDPATVLRACRRRKKGQSYYSPLGSVLAPCTGL